MIGGAARLTARFDAADGRGRSFELRHPVREIVAWAPEDVVPAIERVADAAARGLHAGGFIAYEAAVGFDRKLVTHPSHSGLPLVWFGVFRSRGERTPPHHPGSGGPTAAAVEWRPTLGVREYEARVERIRRLIEAGDTYQVNLTFPLIATGAIGRAYEELLLAQRTPYGAHLAGAFGTIVSASPELFFRWRGDELELRPMKGTRPRGRWSAEDDRLARELIESPKERAENLMIVDLLRNDAGRVAVPGSVRAERLFDVERYPTVHQLTSTITARTRPGTTLLDVLRTLFPSGSVTGAPKIRTMEIIREMEDEPRGVYTGAIGFVSPDETVFNVPIRTIWAAPDGVLRLGVGSGITYDSDPRSEYAECLQKSAFVRHRPVAFELLETMAWHPSDGVRRLDRHLARIGSSAAYFGIPFDSRSVERAIEDAIAAVPVTIEGGRTHTVDPGAVGREPRDVRRGGGEGAEHDEPPAALRVRLTLDSSGGPCVEAAPFDPFRTPLLVRLDTDPVDGSDPLVYHKTTRRHRYDARRAAHPECDDVLMMNERGELTEFTTGNLVIRIGGKAFTPPIDAALLPGVARAERLERGQLIERTLDLADLAAADAVFHLNSLRGLTRVEISR